MTALSLGPARAQEFSFKKGVMASCFFHAAIFAGVPLFLWIIRSSVQFERPQTFQLVTAPPSLRALNPAEAQKKLSKAAKPTIKKQNVTPVPRKQAKPEENVDELESMLNELPVPARISAPGDFKYNWYLENVTQKISRYWNPSSENSSLSVIVSFTINSDGSISDPVVSKGSGNETLDNLALRAVKMAAPFGKLPPSFSGNKIELTCTLIPTRS